MASLRLLKTGDWSDFKIITDTKTFNVHRCIVASKSTVFKAAFKGDFKVRMGAGNESSMC